MNELRRAKPWAETPTRSESLESRWVGRNPHRGTDESAYVQGIKSDVSFLFETWKDVFTSRRHSSQILAGVTVAAVALPLSVALAVACGLPASAGLIAGGVGGGIAAILGGAPLQVTGPSAALNALVLVIANEWGATAVVAAAIIVGLMQLLFYFARAGKLARFVPEAVLAGFTTGVGLKLLDQQIPLLLDVNQRVSQLILTLHAPTWLNGVNWLAVVSGLLVISFMLALKHFPKFPAAISGLTLVTAISTYLSWNIHRVGHVPASLPSLAWPDLSMATWLNIVAACVPLAILATIESLFSAQVVDRIKPDAKAHAPNLEVFGQGIANIGAGLFGGFTVSGVVVRTSVNVASGATNKLSALTHAAILLIAPLVGAKWIGVIPIAALAGLLCFVGYRLIEVKTFVRLVAGNKLQALAFALAAGGVVSGHLSSGLLASGLVAFLSHWLEKRKKAIQLRYARATRPVLPAGIRAKIAAPRADHFYRAASGTFSMPDENWESHVRREPLIHPTAFVHEKASLIGHVVLGPGVHVATEAALRADEGTPFYVGSQTNVQDGVVLHALKRQWVIVGDEKWAIFVGDRVSLAHQCLVHGPAYIGDDTFVGFKAVVHNSVVGKNCSIGIGAIVVGVEVPDGRFVPPGMLVDTQEKAQALPPSEAAHHHFNEDVVKVNKGLAAAYRKGDAVGTSAHALSACRCC